MKEKMKSLSEVVLKPVLIGFIAIVILTIVLSIPELAGAIAGAVFAWVLGKLIMMFYSLFTEDF